ncbi:MAG TPA: hypothetical protein VHO25_10050 [Polyangiaceae bacterium]|nr:hypothetical protein [Polyangiaceae bacterium]
MSVALTAASGGMSCSAPSGAGVPALNPDDLVEPVFEGISPREFSILITDERMPKPETSKEMVAELERALGARFRSAGFRIDNRNAVHHLSIKVSYKDKPLRGYDREDCVWFIGKVLMSTGAWAQAEGGGCFELQNAYGMDMGGDASRAYEAGLNILIEQLDRGWKQNIKHD